MPDQSVASRHPVGSLGAMTAAARGTVLALIGLLLAGGVVGVFLHDDDASSASGATTSTSIAPSTTAAPSATSTTRPGPGGPSTTAATGSSASPTTPQAGSGGSPTSAATGSSATTSTTTSSGSATPTMTRAPGSAATSTTTTTTFGSSVGGSGTAAGGGDALAYTGARSTLGLALVLLALAWTARRGAVASRPR